jgi:hypothetical protein
MQIPIPITIKDQHFHLTIQILYFIYKIVYKIIR